MGALGIRELLFVVIAAVLFFGARRLPELARGLGFGIRNFRGSLKSGSDRAHKDNADDGMP